MKKLIATLSLALLGVAPWMSVQAANYCDPCCTPRNNCCGSFEVGGEAIYWKACTDNKLFAVINSATVQTAADSTSVFCESVHPFQNKYEWGFRLFAAYYTCDFCNYVKVEWTHLNTRKKTHIHNNPDILPLMAEFPRAPVAVAPEEPPGEFDGDKATYFVPPVSAAAEPDAEVNPRGFDVVRAKSRIHYDTVDLEGGHRLIFCGCQSSRSCDLCCGFNAFLFAALRWTELRHDQCADYHVPALLNDAEEQVLPELSYSLHNRNRFHGGGPRLGMRFRYDVLCGFGIVGKIATSVLVGSRHTKCRVFSQIPINEEEFRNEISHFKHSSGSVCIPALDAKLGVDYCFTCCGTFTIEAGWAWDHLWHGLSNLDFEWDRVRSRTHDFSVGGPYIRAAYRF